MKRIGQLAALLLAVATLSGCAVRVAAAPHTVAGGSQPGYSGIADDGYSGWDEGWNTLLLQGGTPTLTATQQRYGSAALLAWPSALVSVYINEKDGAQWDEELIARSRENLGVAVEWILQQAEQYGANTKLYYDDGSEGNGLFYTETYDGTLIGGEGGSEGNDFHDMLDALCAELDSDALHQKYGTSSIGFLIFLPVEGCSYTLTHAQEDGSYYYEEYSCLYAYDAFSDPGTFDSPAVYAHEILHQYGAPDLYEDSTDYFVTPELTEYVHDTWPDAIMQDTYEPDGSMVVGAIHKSISPLTAYRLGLCDTFAGAEAFPAVTQVPPGVFTYEPPTSFENLLLAM